LLRCQADAVLCLARAHAKRRGVVPDAFSARFGKAEIEQLRRRTQHFQRQLCQRDVVDDGVADVDAAREASEVDGGVVGDDSRGERGRRGRDAVRERGAVGRICQARAAGLAAGAGVAPEAVRAVGQVRGGGGATRAPVADEAAASEARVGEVGPEAGRVRRALAARRVCVGAIGAAGVGGGVDFCFDDAEEQQQQHGNRRRKKEFFNSKHFLKKGIFFFSEKRKGEKQKHWCFNFFKKNKKKSTE
jgi:hypothetical protein